MDFGYRGGGTFLPIKETRELKISVFQKKYKFPAICYQVSFSVCRETAEKVPTLPDNNSLTDPAVLLFV